MGAFAILPYGWGVRMDGDLLTIPEAAAALKVSPVTIARWLKQGRLPAYRMGPRAVRIRRDDLAEVLKPSGHAESSDLATASGDAEAGAHHGNGAVHELPDTATTSLSVTERLDALREAEDLRDRILTRRKGVQLPAIEAERGKEKRGKRS